MHLHLNPSSKFPSEIAQDREKNKITADLINAWRLIQNSMQKGSRVCPLCHRDFEEEILAERDRDDGIV